MLRNERDEETLQKIARAFGSGSNPNFQLARTAMNQFLKTLGKERPSWHVTRQTISNWFKCNPPSFPARNNEFVQHFLNYLKFKPDKIVPAGMVYTSHYDKIISRLIVLFEKKQKTTIGATIDSSFPIYPDASGTLKIYQKRIPHIDKDSLQLGLIGKFITFRRPIGPSAPDEISIEYLETDYVNGNFFVTWHVKIDGIHDTFKGSVVLTGNGLWFYTFNAAKGGRFRILQSEANFWRTPERAHFDGMLLSEKPSFEDTSGAARTTLLVRLRASEDDQFEERMQKNTGRRSVQKIQDRMYRELVQEHLFDQASAIDNRRTVSQGSNDAST